MQAGFLKTLLKALLISLTFSFSSFAFSGNGSGMQGDPYRITSCAQLQEMNDEPYLHYILMNDIDCSETVNWNSGAGFLPIGRTPNTFSGSFDGKGYTIDSLYINRPEEILVALFAYFNGTYIGNVKLTNVNITGWTYAAGLISYVSDAAEIENISVEGNISGDNLVGGVCGTAINTNLSKLSFKGTVSAVSNRVGGLIGAAAEVNLSDSFVFGDITGAGSVGGVVGRYFSNLSSPDNSLITRVYSVGSVNITGSRDAGGLIGTFEFVNNPETTVLSLTDSFSTASVVGAGNAQGAAVGFVYVSQGTINSSKIYFDLTSSNQSSCVGEEFLGILAGCNNAGSVAYFQGNSSADVFANWDFTDVWSFANQQYPSLKGFSLAPTPTPTVTPTFTNTPTATPTNTPTATSTATQTPTSTPTSTVTPTFTPSPTPTLTSTPSIDVDVIKGRIIDSNGNGVKNILVFLVSGNKKKSVSQLTDGNGSYEFTNLDPGNYSIIPKHDGFSFAPKNFTTSNGLEVSPIVALVKKLGKNGCKRKDQTSSVYKVSQQASVLMLNVERVNSLFLNNLNLLNQAQSKKVKKQIGSLYNKTVASHRKLQQLVQKIPNVQLTCASVKGCSAKNSQAQLKNLDTQINLVYNNAVSLLKTGTEAFKSKKPVNFNRESKAFSKLRKNSKTNANKISAISYQCR